MDKLIKATWPRTCAEVEIDWINELDRNHREWIPGDLVWDPKMGEGHVIVGYATCGEDGFYCGYCGGMWDYYGKHGHWPVCQCGGFDAGDHHGFTLRKKT